MERGPEAVEAFFAEVDLARGSDRRLDAFVGRVREALGDFAAIETRARRIVEHMALALQGSLLVRHGDPAVADAFLASRLAGDHGLAFGTLAEGAVGVLVNNAGYGQEGAFEEVPMAEVRRQFETNVFGLVRLTQLVLPGMRRQGWGRVVNLSSMGGRLTLPGGAFYHATKYAV